MLACAKVDAGKNQSLASAALICSVPDATVHMLSAGARISATVSPYLTAQDGILTWGFVHRISNIGESGQGHECPITWCIFSWT